MLKKVGILEKTAKMLKLRKLAKNAANFKNHKMWALHHVLVHNAHTYNVWSHARTYTRITHACIMRTYGCVLRCAHIHLHNRCVHNACIRCIHMCVMHVCVTCDRMCAMCGCVMCAPNCTCIMCVTCTQIHIRYTHTSMQYLELSMQYLELSMQKGCFIHLNETIRTWPRYIRWHKSKEQESHQSANHPINYQPWHLILCCHTILWNGIVVTLFSGMV